LPSVLKPADSRHTPEERKARSDHVASLGKPAPSSSRKGFSGAAQARPTAIVECCCGPESIISKVAGEQGMRALRLTASSHKLGIVDGNSRAEADIRQLHDEGFAIHLWASLPCGPWSLWTTMNLHRLGPEFRKRLHERRAESFEIMLQFMRLAEIVESFNGTWSYEWPAYCFGWKIEPLRQWFAERSSYHCRFDGCRFGLTDRRGNPVRKPWAIMTSSITLARSLDQTLCRCPPGVHAPCEGSVASRSENYTRALAKAAISAIKLQQGSSEPVHIVPGKPNAAKGLPALRMHDEGHVDLRHASSSGLADENETSYRSTFNCGCSGVARRRLKLRSLISGPSLYGTEEMHNVQ